MFPNNQDSHLLWRDNHFGQISVEDRTKDLFLKLSHFGDA
jgi:hypothetical protein